MKDGTLRNEISKRKYSNKSLMFDEIKTWSLQILNGIKYLHENDVTHRDIKPEYKYILKIKYYSTIKHF